MDPPQCQQARESHRQLVGCVLAGGGKAPVLDQVAAGESPDVGLRIADVDRQEHQPIIRKPAPGAYDDTTLHARLFTIPGSHPGLAARLMLERKGIDYKRTDLVPVVSKAVVRAAGFPGATIPALKIDGRKLQGSREISAALDELVPDPPLFPSDPELRAKVKEAERFGDEELQHPIRQVLWWSLRQDRAPLASYSEGARLGIPVSLAVKTGAPIVAAAARFNDANDANVRESLAQLSGLLDRADAYIADGVLGSDEVSAGDLQVGASVRLAMTMDDLRPLIEDRPVGKLADRVIPEFPGRFPPILPSAWLEPLRSAKPAQAPASAS
jgi:glutathione S-transferase